MHPLRESVPTSLSRDSFLAVETEARKPIDLEGDDLTRLILSLEEEMNEAAKELRFEYAAPLRDEVNELKRELRAVAEAG